MVREKKGVVVSSSRIQSGSSTVRSAFIERLGRVPSAASAQSIVIDRRFLMDDVRFERWRIAGPCGEIPAWFLFPEDGQSPLPVVVALHPHGRQFELGKSLVAGLVGDGTRAYGLALARAGFAVLAPDMTGFEDHRPPHRARKTNYALQGETYERLLAAEALVQGETLQGRMLAELSACADVLCKDPRVDGGRIALMGQSFGGQQTIFGMLYDERFRVGVVSCGFSLVSMLIERHISHNLALYVPGLLPDLDFDTLVPALAPRPLTVVAGRRDAIFPVDGVEIVERRALAAWAEAGRTDAVRFRYFDGPHDLPSDALAEAIVWLGGVL
jgi:dienelactone hydrolase